MESFPKMIAGITHNQPPIFFLDESVFSTAQSVNLRVWAPVGPVQPYIRRKKLSFKAIAAIGIIDVAGNVVASETREKSYTTASYIGFLRKFKRKVKGKVVLVVDNLSVHKAKDSLEFCRKNKISLLFNATYSSAFMPVEVLWMHAKRKWRKQVAEIEDFSNQAVLQRKIDICIRKV